MMMMMLKMVQLVQMVQMVQNEAKFVDKIYFQSLESWSLSTKQDGCYPNCGSSLLLWLL